MPVEAEVRFLNIDLLLVGRFDRKALVAALGDGVFVLHDDVTMEGEPCLILEVLEPDLDLAGALTRLRPGRGRFRLPPDEPGGPPRGACSTSGSRPD